LRRRVYPSWAAPSHTSLVMGISSKASKSLLSYSKASSTLAPTKSSAFTTQQVKTRSAKRALHLSFDFFISPGSEIANPEGVFKSTPCCRAWLILSVLLFPAMRKAPRASSSQDPIPPIP
jgi:hypothetical protein